MEKAVVTLTPLKQSLGLRLLDLPAVRRNDGLRSFLVATWLGWQIESNWADPFLFAIYSVVRPVASVLILVVMYSIITQGAFRSRSSRTSTWATRSTSWSARSSPG